MAATALTDNLGRPVPEGQAAFESEYLQLGSTMTATETSSGLRATIDTKEFVNALARLARIVPSRTPKPALTGVLIESHDGTLKLTGTNMEQRLELTLRGVEIEASGDVLVPLERLLACVRQVGGSTFTLSAGDADVTLSGKDRKFRIVTMDVRGYPPRDAFSGEATRFDIPGDVLSKAMGRVEECMERGGSGRYAINGLLLTSDKGEMSVVATDGHMLGMCRPAASCPDFTALVPGVAVATLRSVSAEHDASVEVSESHLTLSAGDAVFTTLLLEGSFTPYADIIPRNHPIKAELNREDFIEALESASVMTSEESVAARMSFSGDGLSMTASVEELGDADVSVELSSYQGESIEIGFQPSKIIRCIKALDSVHISMSMTAPNKPCTIDAGDTLYVIMPVHLV